MCLLGMVWLNYLHGNRLKETQGEESELWGRAITELAKAIGQEGGVVIPEPIIDGQHEWGKVEQRIASASRRLNVVDLFAAPDRSEASRQNVGDIINVLAFACIFDQQLLVGDPHTNSVGGRPRWVKSRGPT